MRLMKYLILRLMPRPETGEFINIGVLLLCDALDWLDYKADIRQIRAKVNRAYPGIYCSVQEDLHLMMQSLDYQKHQHNHLQTLSLYSHFKEGLFIFSDLSTLVSAEEPATVLESLYATLVCQQPKTYAKHDELTSMTQNITALLLQHNWRQYYRKVPILDKSGYRMTIPFVHEQKKAILPLFLRKDVTAVQDNSLIWHNRFCIIRNNWPDQKLIVPYAMGQNADCRQMASDFFQTAQKQWNVTTLNMDDGQPQLVDHLNPAD